MRAEVRFLVPSRGHRTKGELLSDRHTVGDGNGNHRGQLSPAVFLSQDSLGSAGLRNLDVNGFLLF